MSDLPQIQDYIESVADGKAIAILRAIQGLVVDNKRRIDALYAALATLQTTVTALQGSGSGSTTQPDCCVELADAINTLQQNITAMENDFNDVRVMAQQNQAAISSLAGIIFNTILPAIGASQPPS